MSRWQTQPPGRRQPHRPRSGEKAYVDADAWPRERGDQERRLTARWHSARGRTFASGPCCGSAPRRRGRGGPVVHQRVTSAGRFMGHRLPGSPSEQIRTDLEHPRRNGSREEESGGRGSNPRPQAWEACALPTELPPHRRTILCGTRTPDLRPNGGRSELLPNLIPPRSRSHRHPHRAQSGLLRRRPLPRRSPGRPHCHLRSRSRSRWGQGRRLRSWGRIRIRRPKLPRERPWVRTYARRARGRFQTVAGGAPRSRRFSGSGVR